MAMDEAEKCLRNNIDSSLGRSSKFRGSFIVRINEKLYNEFNLT